jgi:putative ABC transport system permease protein
MGLFAIVRQMLLDIREQKLRTFLTIFGITWGTIAVSLLVAFGEGLHKQTLKNMHGMGEALVLMWPGRTTMPFQGLPKGRPVRVGEEELEVLRREIPEARFAGEYKQNALRIRRGRTRLSPGITGTSPEFGSMRNMIPQPGGRFINEIDLAQRRRVVFIGNKLETDLFGEEKALGQTVMINNVPFQVVGVLQKKQQDGSYSGPDADSAFIPETTFKTLDNRIYVNNFLFQAHHPAQTKFVTQRVYEVLGRLYQFDPRDTQAIGKWDTTEGEQFIAIFFGSFRIFLAIIGVCTLIVGGIGVSNIMYVVIEERTREIGIKMAIGAKPRYIQFQFLAETLLITSMGGVLGLVVTHAILAVLPVFQMEPFIGRPEASSLVLVSTTALLGAVGLVAGYFPARRASLLDPVVALKLA